MTEDERKARLERALAYGGNTHTLGDVATLIKQGSAQWWDNGDGMIVTEIHALPLLKQVHYWLIAGELKSCLALEHEINPWAIEQGCTVATACGRRGWGRVAAPTGWRPWHPNFYKPLVGSDAYGE
jgi:hypothetical protein